MCQGLHMDDIQRLEADVITRGGPSRPLDKWCFGSKDHYFSRDLLHQQFQGTIFLMVNLTSRATA